jgi:hypothetical protein
VCCAVPPAELAVRADQRVPHRPVENVLAHRYFLSFFSPLALPPPAAGESPDSAAMNAS